MTARDELLGDVLDRFVGFLRVSTPRQASSVAEMNLTLHQFRALAFCSLNDAVTISELAEFLGVHASVATGIVQRLVERDLLLRTEDAEDRRVRRLALTTEGRAFIEDVMGTARAQRREQLAVLSDDQLRAFADVLDTLCAGLREPKPAREPEPTDRRA